MKNNKKLVFIIFVLLYWISPDLVPGPIDDVIVPILITYLNNRLASKSDINGNS